MYLAKQFRLQTNEETDPLDDAEVLTTLSSGRARKKR